MQILIVEDDVRLARALAHILEENGYGTDVVHDGATGLALSLIHISEPTRPY